MEVSNPRKRIGGSRSGQFLASRRGALILAVAAAILAGVLFYTFVQQYKSSNTKAVASYATVWTAGRYIPQGTAAGLLVSGGYLDHAQVNVNELVPGAITDPSELTGEVTSASIAAGQQVSSADFTHSSALSAYLQSDQRAIAVPLDPAHGLTTYLQQGNTVDVMEDSSTKTTVLAQNVLVLANTGGDVVLRVTDAQALALAGASDTAKLWLTLRPTVGAKSTVQVGSTVNNTN